MAKSEGEQEREDNAEARKVMAVRERARLARVKARDERDQNKKDE